MAGDMRETKKDEFDEIACPYCGLFFIQGHGLVNTVVKCLGCREQFKIIEKDRYSDAIGENFPVIE